MSKSTSTSPPASKVTQSIFDDYDMQQCWLGSDIHSYIVTGENVLCSCQGGWLYVPNIFIHQKI